jgi:hypothetical protein
MTRRAAAKRHPSDQYLQLLAPQPPSGALINAILEHADVRQDLGGGLVVLRLTERRIRKCAIRRRLGKQAGRLGQVSLIWDEIDEQVVRVCDAAESAKLCGWGLPEPTEFDQFELTDAGLAYVANFESENWAG